MSVHHHRPAGSAIIIISLDGHFLVNKLSNCWWILFFSCCCWFCFPRVFVFSLPEWSGLVRPLWVDRNLLHGTGSQSLRSTAPDYWHGDGEVDDDAANRAYACNKLNAFHIAKSLVMNGQKLGMMADGVPFSRGWGWMWIRKGGQRKGKFLLDWGASTYSVGEFINGLSLGRSA